MTLPIALTSPMTRGNDVIKAQELLHHNRFDEVYLTGPADGVFGPMTAQACHRAKYWLGYREGRMAQTYGEELRSYLLPLSHADARRLGRLNAIRRRRRIRQRDRVPMCQRAFTVAVSQIGTSESPYGSNRVKYSEWYGLIGPWCAMFVTWCMVSAGSKAFERGHRYSYVPDVLADARAGRNHLTVTHAPQRGDLAIYDWDEDGIPDHMGFFEGWVDHAPHTTFDAVEGNTGNNSNSNGGTVMRRTRYTANVVCFVHCSG